MEHRATYGYDFHEICSYKTCEFEDERRSKEKNLSSHFKITGILKKVRFYKHADF